MSVCLSCELEVLKYYTTAVYDAIYARSKSKFDALKTEGALLCNYACVLEMLLRLRQAFFFLRRFFFWGYASLARCSCNYACVLAVLLRLRQVVSLLALLVQKYKY